MSEATRQVIEGVQILRYPDQSMYVEVAELVRLVHQAKKSFSFEHGEILPVRNVWIYRAKITVDSQTYIGDAEIHFSAPRDTPDGTNPISCAQTSALGNALAFAGFGDLSSTLERLNLPSSHVEGPTDPAQQDIEGVRVIWYQKRPYVPVAERLRHLHREGVSLSMEEVDVQEYQGVWIYRVSLLVAGKRFVGDAEIFFDAPEGSLDHKYPVTCGQTSAVGAALGYAGFGDVQSLLHRQGKQVEGQLLPPTLAPADAVQRALLYGKTPQHRPQQVQQQQPTSVTPRRSAAASPSESITEGQMERIRHLCERLGETEPDNLASMNQAQAQELERSLLALEEELFATVDQALSEPDSSESATQNHQPAQMAESSRNGSSPATSPVKPQAQADLASSTEIGHLKKDWIKAFHISGYRAEVQQKWKDYKLRVCQVEVSDDHMTRAHYNLLRQDIAQQQTVPVQGGKRSQ